MRSNGMPWTEDELGYVVDTMDQPVKHVAASLGRSKDAVQIARKKMRAGWTRKKRAWTPEDDAFLRQSVETRKPVKDVAHELGRTVRATQARRQSLGLRATNASLVNPWNVSNRPLLAKTCRTCGLLLPSGWFRHIETKGMKGWHSTCRKCLSNKAMAADNGQERSGWERAVNSAARFQALTIPAPNAGNEYTEADHRILSNPELTALEKALKLGRSYHAVHSYCARNGYRSHVGLGDPERDLWLIQNPNASRIDEITASLKQEFETAGVPFPAWDWDDEDLKELAA